MDSEIQAVLAEIKSGLKSGMTGFDEKFLQLERRLDDIEVRGSGMRPGTGTKSPVEDCLKASEDLARLIRGERKSAIITIPGMALDLKATITSGTVGSGTSGVLMPERIPGIVGGAQRRMFMRDILNRIPTSASAVDFVRETSTTPVASPQVEASAKFEATITFEAASAPVRTIATWIPASRQVMDDLQGLQSFIQGRLTYALLAEEDEQILLGSGTGQNLTGLVTAATSFNTALRGSSYTRLDLLRRALQQVERADQAPVGFFVIHPDDWAAIELTKDSQGRYICGDPKSNLPPSLWGRPVAVTTAMDSSSFLAGSSEAAELRIRQDITVEISTEHSDFFTKNLVAIRAEERVALPIFKPAAMIYGSLLTSPAS